MEKNRLRGLNPSQIGPVTLENHPAKEPKKQSLAEIALEGTLLAILTLGGLYGCWKIYDYADTQRREASRNEKQERQYDIQK